MITDSDLPGCLGKVPEGFGQRLALLRFHLGRSTVLGPVQVLRDVEGGPL